MTQTEMKFENTDAWIRKFADYVEELPCAHVSGGYGETKGDFYLYVGERKGRWFKHDEITNVGDLITIPFSSEVYIVARDGMFNTIRDRLIAHLQKEGFNVYIRHTYTDGKPFKLVGDGSPESHVVIDGMTVDLNAKFCKYCGKIYDDKETLCKNCGAIRR